MLKINKMTEVVKKITETVVLFQATETIKVIWAAGSGNAPMRFFVRLK